MYKITEHDIRKLDDRIRSAFPCVTTIRSENDYEIMRVLLEGCELLIYPHMTRSTFNQSFRVRLTKVQNSQKASSEIERLDLHVNGYAIGFKGEAERYVQEWLSRHEPNQPKEARDD